MRTIRTATAPAAIGPCSQARVLGNLLFSGGQLPQVPVTMDMVGGSIEAQTERVIRNLNAVMAEVSTDWSRVLKTTVYLTDLDEFAAFNAVYEKLIGGAKPARSTVQVAALPNGAKVQIEVIAAI